MKRLLSILSLLLLCVGGISAQTSVSIDMTNAIVDESSYLCTYSSEQNLDFSGVDGIKAYVATKNHDKYGAVVSVTLKPIATVPSGTGVVLKAEAAQSYTVPTIDLTTPEELKNDLIAALADVDLHEAVKRNTWGDFTSGAIGLAKGIITTGYDENWNPIFGQAIGFFTYPRTYAAGESFIKAGDAYLNIADGEWDNYGEGYVKLEFADAAVAEYNGIGQLLAIPVLQDAESTPAKLNLQHTCTVNWTDGKYALVSDPSGAVMLQVPEGVSMKAGDMLSGTYTGNYNNMLFPQLLVSAITNAADLTVLDGTDEPQAKKVTLEEAFEAANVMHLVQLDNLKLHIEKGTYSNDYFVQNDEGTEAYLNDVFNVVGEQITTLEEGSSISIKGFGFIIPEGSPYLIYNYPQYELVPLALTVNKPEPAVPTSMDIDMTQAISFGDVYLRTFSCEYDLDFTTVEGIKAYVVSGKNLDNYGAVTSATLKPIDIVPAGTGVVLKAEAAKSYAVVIPEAGPIDDFQNLLVTAQTDIDLYDAITTDWGDFVAGPATLTKGAVITGIDENYNPVFGEDVGFFACKAPDSAGESFIKAGEVYLPIVEGEWDAWGHGYVKLTFADVDVAEYNDIAGITALPVTTVDGTPAKLNMPGTANVDWTNGQYALISDQTGGMLMQVPEGVSLTAGDVLSGSFTGNFINILFPQLLVSPLTDSSEFTVLENTGLPQPKAVGLADAYEGQNLMHYVQLNNLKLRIEKGSYTNDYYVQDQEGAEVYLNDVFGLVGNQIASLDETASINITGFGFIIPDGSPYLSYGYEKYELVPLALTVNEPEPEPQPYAFMASEWPAGDPGRISASNVTVDAEQNTITVNQTGDNNVALKFVSTSEYYVTPEQRYFTIRATGLSTAEGKSYLWWLNNANHGSQVAPTTIYKDGDVTVFAWDIRTCGLGDNFSATENTLLQTTGDWITTFGLTQADAAVPAVISYIGFETTVPEPIVEYEYSFVASEWPAGDPNRTTPDEVTVDDEKNTITVNSTGDNNVALNFKTDKTYYVGPGKQFFVIQATGLSTQAGASKLWWLNAKNNGAEVEPTTIKTKDGLTTLIWDITADATFASGFNFQENSYLDGTGAGTWGWTTTFGLTQQDADVPVVISYIGYDDAESDKVKKMPVYKVNELVEGQVVRTTEGEAELGSTVKVPYRHYNVVEGSLYSKGATSKEYNYSFAFNTDGQEENITGYTATGKQDIVFLSEGEDIKGLTRVTSGNSAIRSSNSAAAFAAEADVEIVKLPAGTYKLTAAIFDASKNPNSNWFFIAGTDTVARLNCTAVNYQELTSEKFTLDAETSLYLAKGGNGNMGLDLVYIQAVEAVTPVFAYTVNEVAAGQVVRTTTGTADKASSVKIPFRQYNVVDGNLYKKGQINKEFNYSFTLNEDQQVENLEYNATDVTDVVFLSEGEDIEGLTPITTGNTAIRSSNSAAGYAAEADVEFVTLPSGTYKLTAVIYDSSKTPDSHWIFKAGDTEIADLNCTTVNIQELTSDEFTLETRTALTIAQGGSSTQGIDLIYIVKTADVTDGIATVSTDAARGDNVYDLQGRRVHSMQRSGIYVKNGKKVVKK